MPWLWGWKDRLPGEPEIHFDPLQSGTSHWKIKQVGEDVDLPKPLFFEIGITINQLARYQIVPYAEVGIVRGDALSVFKSLPIEEVDFHEVRLVCEDGETDEFTLVRPKVLCWCTDMENSNVEWVRQNELYTRWRHLQLLDSCMGSHEIVREKFNRWMIVSRSLKTRLEGLDPYGIAFIEANGSRFGV